MSDAVVSGWALECPAPRNSALLRFGPGRLARRPGVALAAALALLGVSGGLGVVFWRAAATPDAVVTARPAVPRPLLWIDIERPLEIYSLEARALSRLPSTYAARRRESGPERQDILGFGTFAGDGPALRLRIHRRAGPAAPVPLFPALAREAADAGLAVLRSSLPDAMPTRFGTFDVSDLRIADLTRGTQPESRACRGFRLALDRPALTMTGLACGDAAHPLTPASLGCLIDRLDLTSGGADEALVTFFARTELERNSACGGIRLGPDAAHAAWLDDIPATSRKSLRRH